MDENTGILPPVAENSSLDSFAAPILEPALLESSILDPSSSGAGTLDSSVLESSILDPEALLDDPPMDPPPFPSSSVCLHFFKNLSCFILCS